MRRVTYDLHSREVLGDTEFSSDDSVANMPKDVPDGPRDIVQEIDILFNFRPGPSLRNELAHGKLPWGAFHSPETITACWFIFNLACRPIFDRWQASVAPAIEMEL